MQLVTAALCAWCLVSDKLQVVIMTFPTVVCSESGVGKKHGCPLKTVCLPCHMLRKSSFNCIFTVIAMHG